MRSDPDGSFRNLFVVSLERDELTLVRVDGRLDRVLAEAMAKDPKKALGGGHTERRRRRRRWRRLPASLRITAEPIA